MPDWRPVKGYDEAAHAERVRALLIRRIVGMPLRTLVKLQEVAALLEAGDRLDVFLARERLGKRRGKVQVQRREDVDRGMRTEAAQSAENVTLEDEEREAVTQAVRARLTRWSRDVAPASTTAPAPP